MDRIMGSTAAIVREDASAGRLLARLKELAAQADANIYERLAIADRLVRDVDWLAELHNGCEASAIEFIEDEFFRSIRGSISLDSLLRVYRRFPDESSWKEYRYDIGSMKSLLDNEEAERRRLERYVPAPKSNPAIERREEDEETPEVRDAMNLAEAAREREAAARRQAEEAREAAAAAREEADVLRSAVENGERRLQEAEKESFALRHKAMEAEEQKRLVERQAMSEVECLKMRIAELEEENSLLRERIEELERLVGMDEEQ